jgi:hypothetical protein
MKINIRRLLLVYTGLFLCLNLVHCCSIGKIAPEHKGVDPQLEHFVKKYKEFAAMQGIGFKHEVTVGFKNINDGATVGLTHYGNGWREIDIDAQYYKHITELSREALLFHELTHSYCERGHTYEHGKAWPEYDDWHGKDPKEGRYKDGTDCPLSLMFPVVLDDFCMLTHYTNYVTEMFQDCVPY